MLRRGYVQQQIDALGLFLARLLRLRQESPPDAALRELLAGARSLLGLDLDTVALLPEAMLPSLFHQVGQFDAAGAATAGTLLAQQAEIFETGLHRPADAAPRRLRALALLAEALAHEPLLRTADFRARVADLEGRLADEPLSNTLRLRLAACHEACGEFARAEDQLYALEDAGDPHFERLAEAFYRRLLPLPDATLTAGSLPRAEVEEGLRRVSAP